MKVWGRWIDRDDLLDILENGGINAGSSVSVSESGWVKSVAGGGEFIAVWPYDPQERSDLPVVLGVPDDQRRDLYAWVGTYFGSVRPLTAYCRVMSKEEVEDFLDVSREYVDRRLERAGLGLVFGEAAAYLGSGKIQVTELSVNAFMRTLSAALMRAQVTPLGGRYLSSIPSSWSRLRQRLGHAELDLASRHVELAWSILLGLFREEGIEGDHLATYEGRNSILEGCKELKSKGAIDRRRWESLAARGGLPVEVPDSMDGPREGRVKTFEEIINNASSSPSDSTVQEFGLGYLASQIAPGSMDHFQLIGSHCNLSAPVALWYGLCCGLHPKGNLDTYGEGLARRLQRELLGPTCPLSRPECDVALDELLVLLEGEGTGRIRTRTPDRIRVDIAPMVSTFVRHGSVQSSEAQISMFPKEEMVAEARRSLAELREVFNRGEEVYGRLLRILEEGMPD